MAKFCPFKTKIRQFFCQNWQFWKFMTYTFQTPSWIFLNFGMEVVLMVFFEKSYSCWFDQIYDQNWQFWESIGLSVLAVEAYGFTLVRLFVRPCVRHTISGDHQILIIFCTKIHFDEIKKCSKRIFEKNSRLPPRGGVDPKKTFLAEKWPFEPISSKLYIRFWWFFHDVRYYWS